MQPTVDSSVAYAATDSTTAALATPKPWFFSRWPLHVKARSIRALSVPTFFLHNAAHPSAAGPDEWIYADATLGKTPSKRAISIAVYRPSGAKGDSEQKERAAMINYHGGGFTIGSCTDDARWCRTVCNELDMVVFSVEYRMAPEQSFPVPVEDCVDAIAAIIARAAELGIDGDNITLSGFSAGGNLALASWIVCQTPTTKDWSYPSLQTNPDRPARYQGAGPLLPTAGLLVAPIGKDKGSPR
jgi:acetyl esterase/lipase